ncbi:hypothetical protein ACFQ3W_25915 [Paenibacillus puldeungensis]|uniref:Uncharacterized protein n=1 Tax=Paenibacillus puldeungensis TaxID=696536 RepID=A0ABW3S5T3_9BACL
MEEKQSEERAKEIVVNFERALPDIWEKANKNLEALEAEYNRCKEAEDH